MYVHSVSRLLIFEIFINTANNVIDKLDTQRKRDTAVHFFRRNVAIRKRFRNGKTMHISSRDRYQSCRAI